MLPQFIFIYFYFTKIIHRRFINRNRMTSHAEGYQASNLEVDQPENRYAMKNTVHYSFMLLY